MSSRQGSATVVETTPVREAKYCLMGLPDVGLVGPITVGYIIRFLEMEECCHVESDLLPPVVVVHEGLPKSPVRVFRKDDLLAVTSEIPIHPRAIPAIAIALMEWLESKKIQLLVSVSGFPVQNRLEIEKPSVYAVGSEEPLKETISRAGLELFEEGFIVGTHAYMLGESKSHRLRNILLLSQSHLNYPDPEAAVSAIHTLEGLLGIQVDTTELEEQSEQIRLMTRELMKRTTQTMRQMGKGQELELPAMYR
ncbi:MAG: proteasome assembly chaperone family protein [Candidatus Geothermarchaeales archaeon]